MAYAAALFVSLGIVANMEWRTDEDMVTLAALIAISCLLGWFRSRLFLLSGIVLGLVVPALNLLTAMTGIHPAYETAVAASAHGFGYVASLLILVFPALCGAFLGKIAARRLAC